MEAVKNKVTAYASANPLIMWGLIFVLVLALLYMCWSSGTQGRTWYGTKKAKKADPLAYDDELDQLISAINQRQKANLLGDQ